MMSELGTSLNRSGNCLGLVSGLGMGAGVFYYRALVQAHKALSLTPRLVLVHADLERVIVLASAQEPDRLAEYLSGLIEQLRGAGASVAVLPAFTPHICNDQLTRRTPLPLVGLLGAIAEEVRFRQLRRVALLGSRVTLETDLFGALANVTEVIRPSVDEVDLISRVYTNIARNESATAAEFDLLRNLAETLVQRESLDAVVLARTDLAFVFNPLNTTFPSLDGARVHLAAVMRTLLG